MTARSRTVALLGFLLLLAPAITVVLPATAGAATPGAAVAWGRHDEGVLGIGKITDGNVEVYVSRLTRTTAVAGGKRDSLAVRTDGTVWAWGYNYNGQLGNGTNTDSTVPVQVSGLTGIIAVAGGNGHSLALRSDGTVW